MKNWSRRLAELQASYGEQPISDKDFFESTEYWDFTRKAAEDMINGICGYLRRQGFQITEAEEEKRVQALEVHVKYDETDDMTAFTNGSLTVINAGSSMLNPLGRRELRHFAVQGFRVHEVGHILFSDFPTTAAWLNHLSTGAWWPAAPVRISTEAGGQLNAKLKNDMEYRGFLINIAEKMENALEDGYIEREIQTLYGGLASTELATLNDMLLEDMESFGTQLQKGMEPFFAIMNQLLLYAKFDITMADDCPDEYADLLEECIFTLDEVKLERDPQKRVAGINELLCILYPLLNELVQEMQKSRSQQDNSPTGEESAENAPMTEEQHARLMQALREAAQNTGSSTTPLNQQTSSLANPAHAQNREVQSKVPVEKTAVQNSMGKDAASALQDSDLAAGQWEIDRIARKAVKAQANKRVEAEMQQEMQQAAAAISHGNVQISRAVEVDAQNIAEYHQIAGRITVVSRSIERRFRTLIRDEENDEIISGLTMGTRLEVRQLYHKDGKCFSRKNFPRDTPRLSIGYLADESGSMSQEAINASIRTGIILEDFCRRMELPCYIGGFTGNGMDCQYISYVEYGSLDAKDKYRLTGMQSRGGTPTGTAIQYMTERLKKLPTIQKLLLVSTDGCSDCGADILQQIIQKAKKAGVTVIGAGIGSSRDRIQQEFGDAFLDVSDMEKMPQLLAGIVKRNLLQ